MSRHLAVVFRGTGGVIGEDLVSRTCQGAADLVEEINPNFPATMGGLPVGTAVDFNAPSMQDAVNTAVWDATGIIRDALTREPNRRVVIGGYSAGAVAAARVRRWMAQTWPDNYLCSFSFGDPTRPFGGSYYNGPTLSGEGISSWHYGDINDYRHCWLTDPGDMYGNVPLGEAGDIMQLCYDIVTATELGDPVQTFQAIIPRIPEACELLGIPIPTMVRYATDGVFGNGLLAMGVPALIGALTGFIHNDPDKLTGSAAAAFAAKTALQFVAAKPPTAPHIEYHLRHVWPGQTYLGLAIQHVRDWSSRFPPT